MDLKSLAAGSTININRSDGRVHPAVVVAVNEEGKFIRVEWFENGETKGKDIDYHVALTLNQNLASVPNQECPKDEIKTANKQSVDDSVISSKSQRVSMAVNSRRTNFSRRRNIVPNNGTGVGKSLEAISKIYSSRSLYKDMPYQNSTTTNHSKLDHSRTERKPKVAKKEECVNNNINKKIQNSPHSQLALMIGEYRSKLKFYPLAMDDNVEDHLITVCVRKRPLNKQELQKREVDIITVPKKNYLIVHEPKTKVDLTKYIDNHNFKFDYAFDEKCDNSIVYKYTAQPLVRTIFEGGFATCFAYGQTGSGKTYTMSGDLKSDIGIYGLAIADVFKLINSSKYRNMNLTVSCSFFEIYSGKVLDLLNSKATLKILEDGKQQVQVVGLKERVVINTNEVLALISKGNILRTSGITSANATSSRSHAVFQIYLRNYGEIHGKLSLIDLAGNERGADTFSADRQTRLEGGEINKSLLALKECIRALGRKGAHLPFRVSKLTQVLRDSFVGNNSRTCMIAMLSPGVGSCENTLNTLRYADRVKELGTNDDLNEVGPSQNKEVLQSSDILETFTLSDEGQEDTAELQDAEQKVFDSHKFMLTKLVEVEKEGQHLLKTISNMNFEKKQYVEKFESLIDDTISNLLVTKDYIDEYKTKLTRF